MFERRRIRHQIHEVPDATSATTDGDVACVTGIVRAIDPLLTSLLAARPCVAYRTRVSSVPIRHDGQYSGAVNDGETVAVARFAVDRGAAGLAIVEGNHALFDAADLDLPRDNQAREEHVLLLHGMTGARQTATFHEAIIEVGATVSIVGVVMFDLQAELSAGEHGFRDELAPQLRLVGDFDHPLLISQTD
jgi:hypothetical protein